MLNLTVISDFYLRFVNSDEQAAKSVRITETCFRIVWECQWVYQVCSIWKHIFYLAMV